MPIVPFYSKLGERAFKEMRTMIVMPGTSLPAGPYGFVEFYCDEVDCECRRVLFQVIRPDTGGKVRATINFGWETPGYYRKWSGVAGMANEMASASLEPFGAQTEHSAELLKLFADYVQPDAAYVASLKKHYAEVKRMCRERSGRKTSPPDEPKERHRRRRRTEGGA